MAPLTYSVHDCHSSCMMRYRWQPSNWLLEGSSASETPQAALVCTWRWLQPAAPAPQWSDRRQHRPLGEPPWFNYKRSRKGQQGPSGYHKHRQSHLREREISKDAQVNDNFALEGKQQFWLHRLTKKSSPGDIGLWPRQYSIVHEPASEGKVRMPRLPRVHNEVFKKIVAKQVMDLYKEESYINIFIKLGEIWLSQLMADMLIGIHDHLLSIMLPLPDVGSHTSIPVWWNCEERSGWTNKAN